MVKWQKAIRQYASGYRTLTSRLLVVMLGLAVAVMIYNAMAFHSQLEATRTAASDSRVWSVSQVEVDHQKLLYALAEYQSQESGNGSAHKAVSADDIVTKFDIFYSRVSILSTVLNAEKMNQDVKLLGAALLLSREELANTIDQLDFADPKALAAFQTDAAALNEPIRQITLGALQFFVEEAQAARTQEGVLWARVLQTTFALLILMGAAIGLAFQLRKQMGAQLESVRHATDNLRMTYEVATIAVIVTDRMGKVLMFNPGAQKLFGRNASEMLGRNVADTIIPHRLLPAHLKSMEHYSETGQGVLVDGAPVKTVGLRADGTEVQIEITIRANHDISGQETLIAFIRDISEQMSQEENLRNARDDARSHAAAKSKFLATMSHEMRTPLYGLLASLDLIDMAVISQESRKLINTARDCGKRSLQQINDVLQISQMDQVQEPLALVKPAAVVEDILNELRALATDHGNLLSMNVIGAPPEQVWLGQPKTFAGVMYNLIGNAIKFTRQGKVTVDLSFTCNLPQGVNLFVKVTDTGVGISPEDCNQIFDPFFTSAQVRSRENLDHTGLGLPIAKMGVEKMGGLLEVSSRLGHGSSFFFYIPLLAAPDDNALRQKIETTVTVNDTNLICLVVDDNRVNLDLTAQLLRKIGCQVQVANSGADAVKLCGETEFDVIFMDMNMPGGLSGTEATHLIRASGCCQNTTVIALTADTTFQGKDLLAASKMNFVLHKPVDIKDLATALNSVRLHPMPTDIEQHTGMQKTFDNANSEINFGELFDLVGEAHALKLLAGVRQDIEVALISINQLDPLAADHLHRAIGSTAMIGLLRLSKLLRKAEDHVRNGSANDASDMLAALHNSIREAQKHLDQVLH